MNDDLLMTIVIVLSLFAAALMALTGAWPLALILVAVCAWAVISVLLD